MRKMNMILLGVNILILVTFLCLWIAPSVKEYLSDVRKSEALGMKPYMRKPPFTVLVGEDFPVVPSFLLGVDGVPVVFHYTQDNDDMTAKVSVGLNSEVSLTFEDQKSPVVRHLIFINDGMYHKDIGGNGVYEEVFEIRP